MPRIGKWARASILSLLVGLGVAVIWAGATPRSESDWLGARIIVPLALGFAGGTVFATGFATVSLFKGERGAGWAGLLATPPLLLLLAGGAWYFSEQARVKASHQSGATREAYLQQIIQDPEVVRTQHWGEGNDDRWYATISSFSDRRVHYTDAQLRRLYDEAPRLRDSLFYSLDCTPQFIAEHFDEAVERARASNVSMLAAMKANPNTPKELWEKLPKDLQS